MRKKTKTQKKASPDSLLKTSSKNDVELMEQELEEVSGGITSDNPRDRIKVDF